MFLAFLMLLPLTRAFYSQFMFELPDKEVQCFFEEIPRDTEFTLLFQVVAGGHYDVDCFIEGPSRQLVYREHKLQHGTFAGKAELPGVYRFCFGNQFSTYTHKKIYFYLQVGKELPVVPRVNMSAALTQLESSCDFLHSALSIVVTFQSRQRILATIDGLHAKAISTHLIYWALSETILLCLVTIGQMIILKRFFTEKKANASMLST
uniref:transmembrane emp24 domain-containing protein 3-like n=1 Tax=Pristiophorus japonicus TaxID=55135 RepID=UPI00398EF812